MQKAYTLRICKNKAVIPLDKQQLTNAEWAFPSHSLNFLNVVKRTLNNSSFLANSSPEIHIHIFDQTFSKKVW